MRRIVALPLALLLASSLALLAGCASHAAPATPATRDRIAWTTLAGPNLGWPHRVGVYLPPGYAARDTAANDLLVVFDGPDYVDAYGLVTTLDTLIAAGRMRPTVAVLVDDSTRAARTGELGNSARFARFVAADLVPWARARWRVSSDPHRATLLGSSAGGLAAAFIALSRPDMFGNVLSQSGAFWRGAEGSNDAPYEFVTALADTLPRRDVRFVLDVGSTESGGALGGSAPSLLDANRHLRDALGAKGYAVTYTEIEGGVHSPDTWGPRLPVVLAALARP